MRTIAAGRRSRRSRVACRAIAVALALLVVPAQAEPAQPSPEIDRLALVGLWTDDGDCGRVTELRGDGVFVAPNGAVGAWMFDGTRLTLAGPGGTVSWRVRFESPDRLLLTGSDGSESSSSRCPSPTEAIPVA
jgi:hypothetical protein